MRRRGRGRARAALALVVLVAGACAPAASVSPTPSPSASASPTVAASPTASATRTASPLPSTLAVIDNVYATTRQGKHPLALVRADGRVTATVVPAVPSVGQLHLPMSSATKTRVYYLDGDVTVMALGRDGTTELVRKLTLAANERAIIAVSPDGARVAIALLAYGAYDPGCQVGCVPSVTYRVYVEDLLGGKRVDLITPRAAVEDRVLYPAAWEDAGLVLVEGPANAQNTLYQLNAVTYQVVDPATGVKRAAFGGECRFPSGPLSPSGVACALRSDEHVAVFGWDGRRRDFGAPGLSTPLLSPDGTTVAGTDGTGTVVLRTEAGATRATTVKGRAVGWIASSHLLCWVARNDDDPSLVIVDVATNTVTAVSLSDAFRASGGLSFFATLPVDPR